MPNVTQGTPIRITSSTLLRSGSGLLVGWLVNTTSGGTITLYNATSATGTPFANTIATTAGAYTPCMAAFDQGLHCVIAGTCAVTFFVA